MIPNPAKVTVKGTITEMNKMHLTQFFLAQIWIFVVPNLKLRLLAGKTAQQGKVLATKPDSLSSVPETHMGNGENRLMRGVLGPAHSHTLVQVHTHTHTQYK